MFENRVTNSAPTFSVIVPTRGRPAQLTACLDSLQTLNFPAQDFEVIVVDDGSPATVDHIVAPITRPKRVVLLRTTHAGPAAARNAGAQVAQGRFVAFTDDDCRVEASWLERLGAILAHRPDQMVGGPVLNRLAQNNYAVASQVILDRSALPPAP